MARSTSIFFGMAAILSLHAPPARGQAGPGGGTWGFVTARYDTRASSSIYTGYGWRGAFAMGGVLHDPRSGNGELVGGVGVAFRTGVDAEHWLAFATGRTAAASFAKVYWLPTVRTGAVTSRATVVGSLDAARGTARKLSVSPLSIVTPLGRGLSGGAAVDVTAAEGAPAGVGAGFELRLTLPGAACGVDALRGVTGTGARLRLFFASVSR